MKRIDTIFHAAVVFTGLLCVLAVLSALDGLKDGQDDLDKRESILAIEVARQTLIGAELRKAAPELFKTEAEWRAEALPAKAAKKRKH